MTEYQKLPRSLTPSQDRIYERRKIIYDLCFRNFTQKEISKKTGYSISTIEKDLKAIREGFGGFLQCQT